MPPKICLFAQYDPGPIPPHTVFYLSQIRDSGFMVHLACAGREQLSAAEEATLGRLGITGWCRPNEGLDFGGWQYLMRKGLADGADRVLLANDSVFGPLRPLPPLMAEMDGAGCWGMVESLQQRRHLQSWFLCLSGKALAAPAVRRVFAQDFVAMSKAEIILHGELGLSVALQESGIPWRARWTGSPPGWRGVPHRLWPANPAHCHWLAMIRTARVPFVKTELLRDNPMRLRSAGHWRQHVASAKGFDLDWIDLALTAAKRPRNASPPALNWKGRLAARLGSL